MPDFIGGLLQIPIGFFVFAVLNHHIQQGEVILQISHHCTDVIVNPVDVMRCAAGIAQWTHLYGYRCAEDGRWVIEESEAENIRRIFREYLEGRSLPEICEGLMQDGIPSPNGKQVWTPTAMAQMLHNERYMGDKAHGG